MNYKFLSILIFSICYSFCQEIEAISGDPIREDHEQFKQNINQIINKMDERINNLNNDLTSLSDSLSASSKEISSLKEFEGSFDGAFIKARYELGPDKEFIWNGNKYKTTFQNEAELQFYDIEMRIIKDQLDGSWVMDKYNLSKRERSEFLEKLK